MTRSDEAQRFKQIRDEILELTQSELADRLGCSRQHISRVELGQAEYTFRQTQKLSNLLGVPVCSFFDGYIYTDSKLAPWLPEYMKMQSTVRDQFNLVISGIIRLVQLIKR